MRGTEDEVRDWARDAMGLVPTAGVTAGAGQLTTFNQLGFPGVADKPDGWWLPDDRSKVAVVLEAKATSVPLGQRQVDEVLKNVAIVGTRYAHVVGILTNGEETRTFVGRDETHVPGSDRPQAMAFYEGLFDETTVDKERIYELTARINNCLHFEVGIKSLYQRMIFTACALVAESQLRHDNGEDADGHAANGVWSARALPYRSFMSLVSSTLKASFARDPFRNEKAHVLTDIYDNEIHPTKLAQTDPLPETFPECVCEIARFVDASDWNGEDVMGIFFNEFNRYKGKSEAGQVLTPEHITDLMYRILDVGPDDVVLDATCGTGGFLTKAMANMIRAAGGPNTEKAAEIKRNQLYGIDNDRDMFALACANMLLHKDGKSNIEMLDSSDYKYRHDRKKRAPGPAKAWMSELDVTRVMMNPPYEQKYHCMDIVANVLESVPKGCMCGFILPDKKLEKSSGITRQILRHNRLLKIIKMPEDLFFGVGITTSIFVFRAGEPQDGHEVFACWMADDGLEVVKNKGRHDVRGRWPAIERRWVRVIARQSGDETCQWLDPSEHLSYQRPRPPFEVAEEDFMRTAMDYVLFERGLDSVELRHHLDDAIMYSGHVLSDESNVTVILEKGVSDGED